MADNLEKNAGNRVGCHCWGTNELSVNSIPDSAAAGCRWLRATRQTQMEVLCPERRNYDFARAGERSVDLAIEHGMSIMAILDGRWGNETQVNRLPWASPIWKHLGECEHFVTASVQHYRGRVKYWEVINEPPFFWWYPAPPDKPFPKVNPDMKRAPIWGYAELLKATARAVRANDPDAKIVAGSGFSDGLFIRRLYELGCKDSFDVASVHYLNCKHPDDFGREYGQVRRVMAEFGDARKPLWDTENGPGGAVIGHAVQTTTDYQGLYNVYRHCFAHQYGLERYFWFNPVRAPEAGVGSEHGIPTRTPDGRFSNAYQALKTLTDFVGDGELLAHEHPGGEVHLYVFDAPGGPASIVWSTAPAAARISGSAEAADYLGAPVTLKGDVPLSGRPLFVRGDLTQMGFDADVTGKRETVVPPWKDKIPPDDTPVFVCPKADAGMGIHCAAWKKTPPVATRDEIGVPMASDHFCLVSSSVPAELKMAYDAGSLYLLARTWDDRLDPKRPTGFVQFTLRDNDPNVAEWSYFYNSYGLFNVYASPRGPMFMRYDHMMRDEYPAGVVKGADVRVEARPDGLLYWARVPWNEIGPCRPGRNNPFIMMFTFNRADNLLDVPDGDTPEEWSHNFGDNFIIKKPALTRFVRFE